MFIMSKDKETIVNLEKVANIYMGADGYTIKANFANGEGCQITRYNSEEAAVFAMEMIANSIGKSEVCFLPNENDIKAKLNLTERKYHHATGKKTKGHGGS